MKLRFLTDSDTSHIDMCMRFGDVELGGLRGLYSTYTLRYIRCPLDTSWKAHPLEQCSARHGNILTFSSLELPTIHQIAGMQHVFPVLCPALSEVS